MSTTITEQITLNVSTCSECGITHALPAHFERTRRHDHKHFYCPNGHSQFFPQETEAEKLRKALHAKELEATRLQNEANEAWTEVGKADRAKAKVEREKRKLITRVHAGVCPCCNRTFQQLARHMAAKHPEFKE